MQKHNKKSVDIMPILANTQESARTANEYSDFLHIEPRDFTRIVMGKRRKGVPIVARSTGKHRGYWLASTIAEITDYIFRFERRIAEMQRTLNALKVYLKDSAAGQGGTSKPN